MTYEQRIRQELERVAGSDEWIMIHCLPDDRDAFEVGIVRRITLKTVFVDMIDTRGRDEGSRSIAFDAIVGLTVGGAYIQNLKILREMSPAPMRVDPTGDGHEGILRAAERAGLVVSIKLPDETVQGFVREVGDGWTAIEQIQEEDGADNGLRLLDLEEAERVFVGGEDETRLAAFAQARRIRESIG